MVQAGAGKKLLANLGNATSRFQDSALRNLRCERIQADELCIVGLHLMDN
jgi:hypothetical protein